MKDTIEYKAFKDNVHGYIHVPKIIVQKIVDTELFQRLRDIEQTGMRRVYPSARHDRFVHSLGVFFLGEKAANAVIKDFSRKKNSNVKSSKMKRAIFWEETRVLFILACILHDIGHAPFSHALEESYLISEESKEQIYEYFNKIRGFNKKKLPASHEMTSAIIVHNKYKETISEILTTWIDSYVNNNFGKTDIKSYTEYKEELYSEEMKEQNLFFISRMITGIKYVETDLEHQIKNCFIEMLNGDFDVDKLDYIVRDTYMSGIDNIQIDVDRLISSFILIETLTFHNHEFNNEEFVDTFILSSGLGGESDGKRNININGDINGSLNIHNYDLKIKKNSKISLSVKKIECKENTEVSPSSEVVINDNIRLFRAESEGKKVISASVYDSLLIKEGELLTDLRIVSKKDVDDPEGKNVYIDEIKDMHGKIELSASDVKFTSTTFSGKISGRFTMEIMNSPDESSVNPDETIFQTFRIGFNKQSLSIIKNVVSARNYLYLWIYSHHKVVYYANYLLFELISEACHLYFENKGIKDIVSISTFEKNFYWIYSVNDADMKHLIKLAHNKYIKLSPKKREEYHYFNELYIEYTTRKFKKSLYKSLPEFDLFFEGYAISDVTNLRKSFLRNTTGETNAYGRWIDKQKLAELGLSSMVWIDASYKKKYIDVEKALVKFSENKIRNFEKLNLFQDEKVKIKTDHYFYIYYSPIDVNSYNEIDIKKKVLFYFDTLIKDCT